MVQTYHFVFVHGASHGAWCWYKVRALLEASGHKATCLDLKGAGINPTDPNTVFTMDDYNQPLFGFMSGLPDDEKVILVGHSIGGASVTEALCKFTSKVFMVVYVAAFMLKPSFTAIEVKNVFLGVSTGEEIYEYMYGQGSHQEPTGMIMKEQYQRDMYYNESPLQDSTLAAMLLRPAPYRALQQVGELPEAAAEVETVPRVYMKTMEDRMFSSFEQDLMMALWPPHQVYCLQNSDHCAFLSNPTALFEDLVQAAATVSELKS